MIYLTVKQSPQYKQMSIEDFLFSNNNYSSLITANTTNTKTYELENVSSRLKEKIDVADLVYTLRQFNEATEYLRTQDRDSLYKHFKIPKRTGGLRNIDAPKEELMGALRTLKSIFETKFSALYHTSAFAYMPGRGTLPAVKRHQSNNSKWYGKLDLHDFFGSTNLNFVMSMLSQIFPFSEVIALPTGKKELEKALELAFLDDKLPQGTPISPLITNVMMIPIDFCISRKLRDPEINQKFVYTRYSDDIIISSRYDFDIKNIEKLVIDVFEEFNAPFTLNTKKTRYGSSSGRNWNLGLMVNKDNEITVGHKKKKVFQSMLYNYVQDKKKGVMWELGDVQHLAGLYSYYRNIERDNIDAIINHMSYKMNVDILSMIKEDLRRA